MRKVFFLLPLLLLAMFSYAQQKTITGVVTNKAAKTPMGDVTVQTKGKTTLTDKEGKFTIEGTVGESIAFSYVGMKSVTIKITADLQTANVALEEGINDLDVVVVTGYKSEKKVDLTGAVSVVNMASIKNAASTSPMLSLQGMVPGLYIQTDGSPTGGNGGPPKILIRGVNTLGNTDPLYIIDGVPTTRYEDFANLSTGAIASIQVLKDASAASIYGSRASNGVIIVTTKDGSSPSGKVRMQLNSSLTTQNEKPWQEDVLSSHDRGVALWRAAVNDHTDPNNTVSQIYTYDWNGDYVKPVLNKVNIAPFVGGDPLEPVANTNWQDELYRKALITSTDLSISAGNSKSGFFVNLGYYNNNGLIQFTNYQRYTARVNAHTSAFNDKLKFGENLTINRTSQVNSTTDVGGAPTPELALTLPPTIPLYKTDGTYGGPIGAGYSDRNNPVDMQYLNRWNTTNQVLLLGNVYADLEIIKHLVFHTSLGFDYSDATAKRAALIGDEGPVRSFNSLGLQESKELTFTWTNTLNYNREFGLHRFNILVGTESVKNDFQTFGASTTVFALQDVNYFQLSAGTGAQTNNGSATGYRLLSQFGKLFYGYSDKYLASVTVRRDGSSRFGTNNPYGFFPAATIGWRINNEDFLKNSDFISTLKLRAGWGKVGNQEIGNLSAFTIYRPNYGTSSAAFPLWVNTGTAYDLFGVNTGSLPSGFVQTQRGNENLKWESTAETNIGIDFGFFKEKITGSFDYFTRNTSDILIQPPVAAVLGEGQQQFLNGAKKDNKGWEFVLGYHNRASGGLSYSITGNASHWKDVITELPENVRAAYPGDPNHSIVGHSQFTIFGYKTDGIFQNAKEVDNGIDQPGKGLGRLRYVDLNGDKKIDANDQDFLGTTLPKLEYGIRVELNYKSFDFSVFGSGVTGKTGFDPIRRHNTFVQARSNFGPGTLDAWTPENPGSKTPALSLLNLNGEDRISDYYYINASYFKLRNVTLGYNLPKATAQKIKMEGLRIYVSGQNLFAIKPKDFSSKDPERVNSLAVWPVPTAFTAGVNLNF